MTETDREIHSLERVPLCFITKADQGQAEHTGTKTYRYKNINLEFIDTINNVLI